MLQTNKRKANGKSLDKDSNKSDLQQTESYHTLILFY